MNALSPEIFQKYPPDVITKALLAHRDKLLRASMQEVIEADREACKSFPEFIRRAWHIVEPSNPYIEGWHIGAIADHLMSVSSGEILRLLINIPPGTAKSLIVSVFWPAFEWGPGAAPTLRYLSTSYSADYVKRDSRRMLSLIQSEWFQDRWPLVLTREGESSFENIHKGFREGVPVTRLTGGRAHRVILDDPHSTEMAESEAERATTARIFRESVPTRLVEPKSSAIIVIMQRLHVNDVSGLALDIKIEPYVHLCLPMEFEPERRCTTRIGFTDPRTKQGELLFPERFPREVVDRDKAIMGSFAVAGQFQQRPTLREGGLFKRKWFKVVQSAPPGTRWIRYWDLAATKDQVGSKAAYTVGLKLGRTPERRFIVGDVYRGRAEGQGVRNMIKNTAKSDGPQIEIGLPQDPGAAGKIVAQDMILMLAGYIVSATRESGDKVQRAEPVAAQAEAGNIDLLEGDWNEIFLNELQDFPGSEFKDQADALSGAFSKLIGDTVFDAREDYISVEPMPVMAIWPRVAAIHIDRKTVTTVWACHNPVTDVAFVYDTITVPRADMAIHANAIKKRGKWIPVMFNLKSKERDRDESVRLAQSLADLDVELLTVELDDEVAMSVIAERISVSSLRVFASQSDWFSAYRRLHRDDKDEIAGDDTGMMRTTGLIMASGLNVAVTENRAKSDAEGYNPAEQDRSAVTGY